MSEDQEGYAEIANNIALTLILLPARVAVAGWAIHLCWNWFVAPALNVTSITALHGMGLFIIATLSTLRASDGKKSSVNNTVNYFLAWVIVILILTGLAWGLHAIG